jgi:hypothetical protein
MKIGSAVPSAAARLKRLTALTIGGTIVKSKKNELIFCKADKDEDFGLPKSIAQVEKEARALGLSYGKYVYGVSMAKADIDRAKARQREIDAYDKRMETYLKASRAGVNARQNKTKAEAVLYGNKSGGRPAIRVQQLNADGEVLATYGSVREAARAAKMNPSSITAACDYYRKRMRATGSGVTARKTPSGFRWRYAPQEEEEE